MNTTKSGICKICLAEYDNIEYHMKLYHGQSYMEIVNHPKHYTNHPSGIECIQITEHMNFCLGNAMKYIWRADDKNGVEDLQKAIWYIEREIRNRSRLINPSASQS